MTTTTDIGVAVDVDRKIQGLNSKLLTLQQPTTQLVDVDDLPFQLDTHQHLFEIHMWVFRQRQNSRYLVHSLDTESPQNVLRRYLSYGADDSDAAMAYNRVCQLFGDKDVTSYLAEMVTPNTDRSKWIFSWDLEWVGLQVVPVFLTVAQMRRMISISPCKAHMYASAVSAITTPDEFVTTVNSGNNNNNKEYINNVSRFRQPVSFLNFSPMMENYHLDPTKIYVPKSVKYCQKK